MSLFGNVRNWAFIHSKLTRLDMPYWPRSCQTSNTKGFLPHTKRTVWSVDDLLQHFCIILLSNLVQLEHDAIVNIVAWKPSMPASCCRTNVNIFTHVHLTQAHTSLNESIAGTVPAASEIILIQRKIYTMLQTFWMSPQNLLQCTHHDHHHQASQILSL